MAELDAMIATLIGIAILWRLSPMSAALDKLTADVQAQSTLIQSAVTLITGLADEIRNNVGDDDALNVLADTLEANSATLSQAVSANAVQTETPQTNA